MKLLHLDLDDNRSGVEIFVGARSEELASPPLLLAVVVLVLPVHSDDSAQGCECSMSIIMMMPCPLLELMVVVVVVVVTMAMNIPQPIPPVTEEICLRPWVKAHSTHLFRVCL